MSKLPNEIIYMIPEQRLEGIVKGEILLTVTKSRMLLRVMVVHILKKGDT